MSPKTKIIATLGPASSSRSVIRRMMAAGIDVVRLNFSHGTHAEHLQRIQLLRRLNKQYRRHIRVLQDLEGYRVRIGSLAPKEGIPLKRRQRLILTQKHVPGSAERVSFDFEGPLRAIKPGSAVYIDDGNIELKVTAVKATSLETVVVVPGVLKSHKGINMPQVRLGFSGLTAKDRRDLAFGIAEKVDFIAQSFVRRREDVEEVREALGSRLPACRIIAKIENAEGVKNIDTIMRASDGIMVARGDLGVSVPVYKIPMIQKMIIAKCNRMGKPVITATQMLESMTEHLRPTRAEVTDVANAIIDGSGYVMLSAETAAGKYPVESVAMMNDIIKFTESQIG